MERLRAKIARDPTYYEKGIINMQGKFGRIRGVEVGDTFDTREKLSKAKVHVPLYAGISGHHSQGAYSIVANGVYEDEDHGNVLIYSGTGGTDDSFSDNPVIVRDQSFEHPDNMALKASVSTRIPVRVIRGYKLGSPYAPWTGYRYDGLYRVTKAYMEKNKDGHLICKFELHRRAGQPPIPRRQQLGS
ncbi:hypothetical protein AX16_007440 [Volvariella volvacea WC 439]|nr:hypothetical protein AX16_007440 [Volvariella volvacea WC 439]